MAKKKSSTYQCKYSQAHDGIADIEDHANGLEQPHHLVCK